MLSKNYSKSVISALIFLCCVHLSVQQCSLAIKTHIAAPSPLILDPVSRNFQRTSDTLGNINFAANQQLLLACTGSGNYLTVRGTGATERVATCVSGQTFTVDGVNYNFNQFICQRWPDSEQRRSGNCLGSKTNVVIGFQTINYWIPLFTCCHDEVTYHTHYTEFNLYKDAATNQASAGRVDWSQGPFFNGVNANTQYTRVTQRATVSTILGSTALGNQFIHATNDFFMSRGHLVAYSDFVFNTQQQATMVFVNANPQWQTFNGQNWNYLEQDVRAFVGRVNQDLIVYTGSHGICTLPNTNNVETNIYISLYGGVNRMQAPKYYWKVVRNPATNTATAFIGMNNPYISAAQAQADVFCADISSSITWLTWYPRDLVRGYSFACDLDGFRRVVTDLPAFTTVGVLR